jgi:citrate lyase subunit beta-like protein
MFPSATRNRLICTLRSLRGFSTRSLLRPLQHRAGVRSFSSISPPVDAGRLERPRRSLFSVPGADPRKLKKAQSLGADAVVLDLEDGVALHKKDDARRLITDTLNDPSISFGRSELCVRINGLDTQYMAVRDLEAVLSCERLQTVVIPKVETASDVHFVSRMMDALCGDRDIRIIAAIESALGMLSLRDIASSDPRLDALVFASEDFCADLEMIRTPDATELLYPRSQLVITAKAFGLQAIDMVHIDFRNLEGLKEECRRGRELGFTGKQAIHPSQVATIHETFAPSSKDVDFAVRVVETYETTTSSGVGACVVDGIVVDAPVYKWAVKMLKRAETAGSLFEAETEKS